MTCEVIHGIGGNTTVVTASGAKPETSVPTQLALLSARVARLEKVLDIESWETATKEPDPDDDLNSDSLR